MTSSGILYEDNHVIVAIKPAGILSQADSSGDPDMLTILKSYLKEKYNKPGEVYLGLLHRLDRPVSGVMVFAKTSKCASRISEQIRQRAIQKSYRAVVLGEFITPKGVLTGFIDKNERENKVTVYLPDKDLSIPESAKKSVLSYEVIGTARSGTAGKGSLLSLVEIELLTGRSHQIRAQFAREGHPLYGDRKYGTVPEHFTGDVCLQAYRLAFDHPITRVRLTFEISTPEINPWNLFSRKEGTANE